MAGIFDYLLDAPSGKQVVPRNMQQVGPAMKEVFGERLPNAALEGPADAASQAAKRGLLGRVLGVAAGPVGVGVQAATQAGDLNEGEDDLVKQRQNAERDAYYTQNPDEARSAMAFGQDVADRTLGNAKSALTPQTQGPVGVMAPVADTPQAEPEVKTPPPEVVEQAKKVTEAKRQVVQQGTIKALQTNQVSRPELAQEIVKSDIQRTGEQITPQAFQKRVEEETSNMKSMDNNDLSRYVSYALVAAGLIASFADKSGKAGDAFSASFNRQLDRNLQNGINNSKIQAKATENAQKNAIKTYELKQGDRKLDQGDKSLANDEKRTTGQLGFWKDSADLGRERIAVSREGNSIQAANANATNGLRSAQMDLNRELAAQRQQNADRDYGLRKDSLAIRQQKAEQGTALKAPELSSKSASDFVKQRADETGISLSKGAQAQVAEQLRILHKANPAGFAKNPGAFYDAAVQASGLTQTGNTNLWDNRKLSLPKSE